MGKPKSPGFVELRQFLMVEHPDLPVAPPAMDAMTIHDAYVIGIINGLLSQGVTKFNAKIYAKTAHHLAHELVKERAKYIKH